MIFAKRLLVAFALILVSISILYSYEQYKENAPIRMIHNLRRDG